MTMQSTLARCSSAAFGAAIALLFAACSSAPPIPPAGEVQSQSAAAQQGQQAPSGFATRAEDAATAAAATPPAAAPGATAAASAGDQAAGNRETIVVSGNRIRRDDFSAPNSTTVVTAADLRNLGVSSVADMVNQVPASASPRDPKLQTDSRFDTDASVANRRDREPLTRVSPGEEVWIISQPPPGALTAAVADDALGSGVMIARVVNVIADDTGVTRPPQPVSEIPLPLKHTDVEARVQGYVGTVDVTQEFANPYNEKIEAVYMFPLPEKAAVSEFVMTIGERRIRGILREKEEAQAIYRQARAQGLRASLLTQHRPNVFEQKVANIEPGKQIDVDIRYYQTLAYADGWYSFVFPTVVGPRYNPSYNPDPLLSLPQTAPPVPGNAVHYLTPQQTSAHDISISVELDAGVEIEAIESSHLLDETRLEDDIVRVELADGAALPNRDFRLDFRVAGERIKSSLLTYVDPETAQGYFTMMLYPPVGLEQLDRQPLELVFVLDCSGSMNGAPMAQAKDAIIAALDRLQPDDTFQIIRFSQSASQFGPAPMPATAENLRAARDYVRALQGMGGTEMIQGIRAALDFPHDEERLRFVTFLTDGFIGNEAQILAAIDAKLGAARIFSFGVGSSPNRYLLERMASMGRGAVAYLSLEDSGRRIMDAFFDRIAHPAMIDVEVDWGRMQVADVYPSRLPDLFVGRPVIVTGRFEGSPNDLRMTGRAAGERVRVRVDRDRDAPEHDFLPNLWARLRIAELNDRLAVEPASASLLGNQIRATALAYNLMSDYTSFIAVDASEVTAGGRGTTVIQAVPVPDGVRYETAVGR
jgi:Ca-activated chloride channel family protein